MTMEIERPDYFMVINTKAVKVAKATKLQQVLDAQKEETLTSINIPSNNVSEIAAFEMKNFHLEKPD